MQAHMEGLQLSFGRQDKPDAAAMEDIPSSLTGEKVIKIIVKPNARKTQVTAIDEARNALRVDIAAPADKDKANKEVIKFFSRLLKKKVSIAHGLRSKEKLLRIED